MPGPKMPHAWAHFVNGGQSLEPGYDLRIRQGAMDHVDVQVLSFHLRQRRGAVWDNLDILICPRTQV